MWPTEQGEPAHCRRKPCQMVARRTRTEQQVAEQRREDHEESRYETGFGGLSEDQPGGVKAYSSEAEQSEPCALDDLLPGTAPQMAGEQQAEAERRDPEAHARVKGRRMQRILRDNIFRDDVRRSPGQREQDQGRVGFPERSLIRLCVFHRFVMS